MLVPIWSVLADVALFWRSVRAPASMAYLCLSWKLLINLLSSIENLLMVDKEEAS